MKPVDDEWERVFSWLLDLVAKYNAGQFGNPATRVDEIAVPKPLFDEMWKTESPTVRSRVMQSSDMHYIRHGTGLLWFKPRIELSPCESNVTVTLFSDGRTDSEFSKRGHATVTVDEAVSRTVIKLSGACRLLRN